MLPGTHKLGKADIRSCWPAAAPTASRAPCPCCARRRHHRRNRQLLHGSFANSSPDRRITLNAGFFPRKRVLGVTARRLHGALETYDEARIAGRSRLIQIAIDARRQRFPQEQSYVYRPLAGREDENRWNETTRATVLRNYNQRDMFI